MQAACTLIHMSGNSASGSNDYQYMQRVFASSLVIGSLVLNVLPDC